MRPTRSSAALTLALAACAVALVAAPARPVAARAAADRPFWAGHPDAAAFTRIQDQRLARARADIARVLAVKGPRTLSNTLRPYDDAKLELDAIVSQSDLIENVHPDSLVRGAAEQATRKGAAYASELSLNRRVYDALAALDGSNADAETRYYVEKTLRDFRLAGVDRDEATRQRIQRLREEIVAAGQEFQKNIRSDRSTVALDSAADLEGLPADFVARHRPGADGRITLTTEYPDYFPVLTYAKREDVRRRMYTTYMKRAFPQNMAALDSLIAKRHRLANLLGFPNWAECFTADKMVGTAANARAFIERIVQVSGERAASDYQVLLERKRKDLPGAAGIEWWDRLYWPTLVRKEQYDFDAQVLRPYFPFDRVEQGVLDVTGRMFGVTYRRVKDAPVWHPSVECWEMFEDGRLAGRFYLDMHPRADKYSHAAQFDVRTGVEGRQIPEAALVCNLPGGEAGDPGLCDMEDVNTFFHEFGHLLHTLFAGHHRWVGVGGIRTEQDFVEAPSQMLEEWMRDAPTLQTFARHHQTGEPIPAGLVQQMVRANAFGDLDPKGIGIRRQMVLADVSLSIYDRDPAGLDTDSLFARLTNRYCPYPWVPDTHFQCAFTHLDGYSAGYYTYMWSEVIAKDLFTKFDRANLLDPAVAKRYRDAVLAPGGSKPAARLVEEFLGRPFRFDAYQAWLDEKP